jgi:hypothetical protein
MGLHFGCSLVAASLKGLQNAMVYQGAAALRCAIVSSNG